MKYITMTALSAVFMLGFILLISESAFFPLPNLAGLGLLYAAGKSKIGRRWARKYYE